MTLPTAVRSILACPRCHGALRDELAPARGGAQAGTPRDARSGDAAVPVSALVCEPCALSFPVRAGIPVMLVDQAQAVTSAVGSSPRERPRT